MHAIINVYLQSPGVLDIYWTAGRINGGQNPYISFHKEDININSAC